MAGGKSRVLLRHELVVQLQHVVQDGKVFREQVDCLALVAFDNIRAEDADPLADRVLDACDLASRLR